MGISQVATFYGAKIPVLRRRIGTSHAWLFVGDLFPKRGLVTPLTMPQPLQHRGKWKPAVYLPCPHGEASLQLPM